MIARVETRSRCHRRRPQGERRGDRAGRTRIAAIDADRKAKDEVIARVGTEIAAIDADRKAKDDVITRLVKQISTIDSDRKAKDDVIASQKIHIEAGERDLRHKEVVNATLTEEPAFRSRRL